MLPSENFGKEPGDLVVTPSSYVFCSGVIVYSAF